MLRLGLLMWASGMATKGASAQLHDLLRPVLMRKDMEIMCLLVYFHRGECGHPEVLPPLCFLEIAHELEGMSQNNKKERGGVHLRMVNLSFFCFPYHHMHQTSPLLEQFSKFL